MINKRFNVKDRAEEIEINAIICLHCLTIAHSEYRWHSARCSCKKVAADGGLGHLRRSYPGGNPSDHYIDISFVQEWCKC